MKVGLLDVDGHNFPNLPLMKLSAYHKKQGNQTGFRVNVDGTYLDNTTGAVTTNLEVRKDDSLYIGA